MQSELSIPQSLQCFVGSRRSYEFGHEPCLRLKSRCISYLASAPKQRLCHHGKSLALTNTSTHTPENMRLSSSPCDRHVPRIPSMVRGLSITHELSPSP